jgi:chemotaxis protein MotB
MRARRTSRKPSHDRWLVSYADFTTLLFAFFTAVYAVTAQDASKLPRLADALTGQDGVLATTAGQPEPIDTTVMPDLPDREPEADVRARLQQALQDDLEQERLQLIDDPRGLVVAIPEAGAFGDGAADLSPDARAIIGRLGTVLATLPNAVRVEGHTDNRPIRTDRYQSNWELSTSRATEVVDFLVGSRFVSADRLSVAGYAEHRPRGDNATVAGRASNRRVDIVVLNDTTRAQEEPAPAAIPR